MRIFFFVCLFLCGLSTGIYGQQSAENTHRSAVFNRAVSLYAEAQYSAAESLFQQVVQTTDDPEIKADSEYYLIRIAVRQNKADAEQQIERFVRNYPESPKQHAAYKEAADYYFSRGNYKRAELWYKKLSASSLSSADREDYHFNLGYIYFEKKDFTVAQTHFNRVVDSPEYGSQAKYYLGFMAYEGDDYEGATEHFDQVKGDDRFAKELSYYEADMNFKSGNFEKAIATGKSQYERSSPEEKNQLSKIIGESYFNLELYEEAIPYLQAYRGTNGKWNNTDYYQLGYAYYQQKDYEKAIGEFNKIISGTNSVAQNAYYHLAESYLKTDRKQQALNAFKNASEMDFDAEIQEDAFLNYAKLSYEIGNSYTSTPQVLMEFIEKYPENASIGEMKVLLIDSYITSRNYKDAMQLLENNPNFHDIAAYQKVAFYRGLELYNEGEYADARIALDKSLKERESALITARATYWRGETQYELGNYREAETDFTEFSKLRSAPETSEYKWRNYALGYTWFKLKNYEAAIARFTDYTTSSDADAQRKKDAYLRLGDSYFASRQYWPAMENYNAVIQSDGKNEYARFQKAVSYGFVDRNERKIEELNAFVSEFKKSVYRADALYELGNTHIAQNNTQGAIASFNTLTTEIPTSKFVPQALMKTALLYDNSGNSGKALEFFERVAKDYPGSSEALQAVSAAKNIYIDEGRVDDYAAWVKTLDFVELGDTELDDSSYQSAEQSYMENNVAQAKKRFEAYLKQFPAGKNALKAHFYLGQLYFANGDYAKAIPHFGFVTDRERNLFTEQALARISEAYLKEQNWSNAQRYLLRLEVEAESPQNLVFAQTNVMKVSYQLEQYAQTVAYAEKVLGNDQIDTAIRSDAQVFIARSALKTADNSKAKTAYAEVKKIASGRLAAEAQYYEAYFKHIEKDYEGSNAAVQILAKEYSAYKTFGAQGLVLMAKNFYALDDAFQATYILENVIQNFGDYPEIVAQAKDELTQIKNEEAKTNTSVEVSNEK